MKLILILLATVVATMALPEHPTALSNHFQDFPSHQSRQHHPRHAFAGPGLPPLPPQGSPHATYGVPQGPPIVTKNVYVHVPPADPEDNRPPQILPQRPPKKHYKLIFIKAPEPPKYVPPILPQQQSDEHKTLVYVLVKKPDDQQQIQLPDVAPTEPSKPEVYFIKYKGQNDQASPYPAAGPPLPQGGPSPLPPVATAVAGPLLPPPGYGPPGSPLPPNVDFGPANY